MMVCFGIFWPLKRPFGLFCPLLVLKKTEKNFLLVNHVNVSFIPVVLEFLLNAQNRFIVLHKQNKSTGFENLRKSLNYIASEASYVYILSGQKFLKNGPFGRVLDTPKLAV